MRSPAARRYPSAGTRTWLGPAVMCHVSRVTCHGGDVVCRYKEYKRQVPEFGPRSAFLVHNTFVLDRLKTVLLF